MWPVGSILITATNENPSVKLGGTWVAYAQGRMIVGMGNNGLPNGNYTVAGGTGGNMTSTLTTANLPSHTHDVTIQGLSGDPGGSHWNNGRVAVRVQADGSVVAMFPDKEVTLHSKDEGTTSAGFFNNMRLGAGATTLRSTSAGRSSPDGISILPPYIACYIWKKTAD